jgi:hypothetical protein
MTVRQYERRDPILLQLPQIRNHQIHAEELFEAFIDTWQAGQVSDLQAGLEETAAQIDAQLAQGG